MQSLKIIGLGVLSALIYGVLHDQITARICVEYFTVGHPNLFGTDSPTLLALGWGIVATWWVGLFLGVLLCLAARIGSLPRLVAANLKRPVFALMLLCAAVALLAGIVGFGLARTRAIWLIEPLASDVPVAKHAAFLADLWAHSASYIAGFMGGWILAIRVCFRRITLRDQLRATSPATSPDGEIRSFPGA